MQVKVSIKGEDEKLVEEAWIQDLVAKLIANIAIWMSQGHTRAEIEEAVKDASECMILDVKDMNFRKRYVRRVE